MAKPKRPIPFSVSLRGIAMVLAATALLLVGVLRGELMATLIGILLFSFLLYSLALAAIARIFWGESAISFGWTHGTPKGFETSVRTFDRNRMVLSFARFALDIEYVAAKESRFFLSVDIAPRTSISYPALPPRGVYEGGTPRLRITDYAGFFSFFVEQTGAVPERLVVIPDPYSVPRPFLPGGTTGVVRGKGVFNRSEDLFDARPYQIGDDPRKINWKLFAHTGKLAVRQGDLLPPPSSEILFIINCTVRSIDRFEYRAAFDSLISRVAHIAEVLLSERRIVTLKYCGHTGQLETVRLDPSDPASSRRLYTYLADISPTTSIAAEALIRGARPSGIAAVFVSLPTLTHADVKALSDGGIHFALIGPSGFFRGNEGPASFIKRLLVVQDRLNTNGIRKPRRLSFRETLTLLEREGFHAEEI